MTDPIFLGDTVIYVGDDTRAAIITGVHPDGSADLTVLLGYCLGTQDIKSAKQSEDGDAGSFYYARSAGSLIERETPPPVLEK